MVQKYPLFWTYHGALSNPSSKNKECSTTVNLSTRLSSKTDRQARRALIGEATKRPMLTLEKTDPQLRWKNLSTGQLLLVYATKLAFMEESYQKSRLKFATSHVGDTANMWTKVLLSDETMWETRQTCRRTYSLLCGRHNKHAEESALVRWDHVGDSANMWKTVMWSDETMWETHQTCGRRSFGQMRPNCSILILIQNAVCGGSLTLHVTLSTRWDMVVTESCYRDYFLLCRQGIFSELMGKWVQPNIWQFSKKSCCSLQKCLVGVHIPTWKRP